MAAARSFWHADREAKALEFLREGSMPSMASLALCFGFIFAVAAGVSYFDGWACDTFGNCTNSQLLGGAAGLMFIAYLALQRLEADHRPPRSQKTEPPVPQH